jgi:hypothetical protein
MPTFFNNLNNILYMIVKDGLFDDNLMLVEPETIHPWQYVLDM